MPSMPRADHDSDASEHVMLERDFQASGHFVLVESRITGNTNPLFAWAASLLPVGRLQNNRLLGLTCDALLSHGRVLLSHCHVLLSQCIQRS